MNTYQKLFLQAILFGLVLATELELLPNNTQLTRMIGSNAYLTGILTYMLICVAAYCNVKSTSSNWIEAAPLGFAILIQLTVAGGAVSAALSATNKTLESAAITVLLLALHATGFASWRLYRLLKSKRNS